MLTSDEKKLHNEIIRAEPNTNTTFSGEGILNGTAKVTFQTHSGVRGHKHT